jgi:phosphotransferase system enzyme I (PtsI)
MQANLIFKHVDFGSIGSNDLIQYLFAVDRNNEQVSSDYNPEHPILWKLLEDLVTASAESGKPLSICGEMAGREGFAARLVDIGIRSLSVSPRLIPRVRTEMMEYYQDGGRARGSHARRRAGDVMQVATASRHSKT